MTYYLLGVITGLIAGALLVSKIAGDEIVNKIGKVKGNGGQVAVDQDQNTEPKQKRKGLLKRIFTKKVKA